MILLTGSDGFIGRAFRKRIDDALSFDIEDCFDFLYDFKDWDNIETIIHQGAISSTIEKDVEKLYRYNVLYSIMLFQKAVDFGIPVKYASSAAIYGNQTSANPLNQYALSKLQVDYWVNDNIDKFSLIQGFRYFNVYGDGEESKGDQASPVSKFAKQIVESGRLRLFKGSSEFYRDFVCVDDVVNIVLNNDMGSGIFDLGTSSPVSFQHVADSVIRKFGGEIEYIDFPERLNGKYQLYTCAKKEWPNYKFMTVEEYLS